MKTKQIILFALSVVGTLPLSAEQPSTFPKAKITVHVIDQDGRPVEGALVGIGGTMNPKPGEAAKGLTTADGFFSAEVGTNGTVGTSARKDGYYDTFGPEYRFRWDQLEKASAKGRLEPWNPTLELVLNKILNPIPMYARRVKEGVPSETKSVGFDLFEGDYVTPNGRGKNADMIFTLNINERDKNDYDYKLLVTFPNKMDGILPVVVERYPYGSKLRAAYAVPQERLLPEWAVLRSRHPGGGEKSNYDPEQHAYFLRVRTVVDSNGKIISANYGKIYGDFMNFTYYLNPTPNDRNVEFDPKRNLFTNLKADERVTQP